MLISLADLAISVGPFRLPAAGSTTASGDAGSHAVSYG
jgi:hypothetical protein